jgi:CPA2 family monovalent cation:H+ antiporter-2
MNHNIPLITTLAAGFSVALVLGFLAERIAVPGAVVQMTLGTLLGMGVAWWLGWRWGAVWFSDCRCRV